MSCRAIFGPPAWVLRTSVKAAVSDSEGRRERPLVRRAAPRAAPNIVIKLRPGAAYHSGRQLIVFPVCLRWRSLAILTSVFMQPITPKWGAFPGKCLQISCGAAEESSPGREPGVGRVRRASSGGAADAFLPLLRSLEASGTPNPQLTLWATFCRTSGARNQVGRRSLVGTGVKTLLKAR